MNKFAHPVITNYFNLLSSKFDNATNTIFYGVRVILISITCHGRFVLIKPCTVKTLRIVITLVGNRCAIYPSKSVGTTVGRPPPRPPAMGGTPIVFCKIIAITPCLHNSFTETDTKVQLKSKSKSQLKNRRRNNCFKYKWFLVPIEWPAVYNAIPN